MSRRILALATCRVSTLEQELNNSLSRQRVAVLQAAQSIGAIIPEDGWWSGSVSSKRGTNVNRKDLQEMVTRCKKDRRIKYIIVDEPDRFMRSIDEAAYFEVTFRELGVTVWYASDPELNKGNLASKLLKFTKYLSAEGSHEERQQKSINGQTEALKEGRWTFAPKPGYKRGYERGIPEVHDIRGPALRSVLVDIATKRITPSKGLIDLNNSPFMTDHSPYKMDKFRKIVTDPFYAGIVEIDKQVQVRNENGLHEALITKEQHCVLLKIMLGKKKNQSGPRRNGNPKYPLSNLVTHTECLHSNICRFVGLDLHNGKNKTRIYEKYRCRVCSKYLSRQELHSKIEQQFKKNAVSREGLTDLAEALETVWNNREAENKQEEYRLVRKIKSLRTSIADQVEAATNPSNTSIKEDILSAINSKKVQISDLEDLLDELKNDAELDKAQFLKFAFSFVDNMGSNFLEISQENRLRCKEIVFPAGFHMDKKNKIYTPEVSPLIRLAKSNKVQMVRVKRL